MSPVVVATHIRGLNGFSNMRVAVRLGDRLVTHMETCKHGRVDGVSESRLGNVALGE